MDLKKEGLAAIIAVIVHEFANPLNIACQANRFTKIMISSGDLDSAVENIDVAVQKLDILNGFLKEVQEIYRGDEISKKEVSVSNVFRFVEASFSQTSEFLVFEKSKEHVDSSFFSLLIILNNLVKNAFDHNPGSKVNVSFSDGVFHVKDDGSGMNDEQISKIFGDYSTKEGGGLGLQIVSFFVERLGAKIEVSSVVGVGTSFRVILN